MRFVTAEMQVYEALDHITAAAEAGLVDRNRWATQQFANDAELEGFLEELDCYGDCYRITDRWWMALAELAHVVNEEGFVSSSEIADGLRESITRCQDRRAWLRQEAEYFAMHPLKSIRTTRAQYDALNQHNLALLKRVGLERDASLNFRFTHPFHYLKGTAVAARQGTAEDLATLAPARAKKSPAGGTGTTSKLRKPTLKKG